MRGQEDKLGYLLVFGMRYRRTGQGGRQVGADSVDKALLAVGQGITDLGRSDPRKATPGSRDNHPLLASFLKALRDEDDPASRVYPVNITIIRGILDALDFDHPRYGTFNSHVLDLIILGFYWLLRPAEYLHSTDKDARSQAFRLQDIHLAIDGTTFLAATAPLNDENAIQRIEHGTLQFSDQKNAVRGEQVGHHANNDPFWCPTKALGQIA